MINAKRIAKKKMVSLFPPSVKRVNMTINGVKLVVVRTGERKIEVEEASPQGSFPPGE